MVTGTGQSTPTIQAGVQPGRPCPRSITAQIEMLEKQCQPEKMSPETIALYAKKLAAARKARQQRTEDEIEEAGIPPDLEAIFNAAAERTKRRENPSIFRHLCNSSLSYDDDDDDDDEDVDMDDPEDQRQDGNEAAPTKRARHQYRQAGGMAGKVPFDFFGRLFEYTELAIEVGRHLKPRDIVKVYSICRVFHYTVNANITSCILSWTRTHAPLAARLFPWKLYRTTCIPDPAGRQRAEFLGAGGPNAQEQADLLGRQRAAGVSTVRTVPGLRWYAMVAQRQRAVRDILAALARQGHRLLPGTDGTLMKLWQAMDVATNRGRQALMHSRRLWGDGDLYRLQAFLIKLHLRLNDPVFGPHQDDLRHVLLGQRSGLLELWRLLARPRADTALLHAVRLKTRYDVELTEEQIEAALPVFGVPVDEVGTEHLEGWGVGTEHLMRPDELLPLECARRGLYLDDHFTLMLLYGHVDFETGKNLVPSEEEIYMSDSDGEYVPCERLDWAPIHAKKHRWGQLSEKEKEEVIKEEMDKRLKELPYATYSDSDSDSDSEGSGGYDEVADEHKRYVLPPKGRSGYHRFYEPARLVGEAREERRKAAEAVQGAGGSSPDGKGKGKASAQEDGYHPDDEAYLSSDSDDFTAYVAAADRAIARDVEVSNNPGDAAVKRWRDAELQKELKLLRGLGSKKKAADLAKHPERDPGAFRKHLVKLADDDLKHLAEEEYSDSELDEWDAYIDAVKANKRMGGVAGSSQGGAVDEGNVTDADTAAQGPTGSAAAGAGAAAPMPGVPAVPLAAPAAANRPIDYGFWDGKPDRRFFSPYTW